MNSLKTSVLAQFGLNMMSFENIGQFSIKFENKTFKFNMSPRLALQDSIISKSSVFCMSYEVLASYELKYLEFLFVCQFYTVLYSCINYVFSIPFHRFIFIVFLKF